MSLGEESAGAPVRASVRRFRRVMWAVAIAASLAWVVAFAWPQTFRERLPRAVVWAGGLGLARMLCFEIGLGLVAAGAVSVLVCRGARAPAAMVASGVLWMVPLGVEMAARAGPVQSERPALRVMTFNVLFHNAQYAEVAAEVARHAPEVVVLAEYTAEADRELRGLIEGEYPYSVVGPMPRGHGVAVYSRLPMVASEVVPFERSTRAMVRAVVEHEGRRVEVMGVHLSAPYGIVGVRTGRDEFDQLRGALERAAHPVVVAGDFNASVLGPQDAALGAMGWRSSWGAEAGYGATWPARGQLHGVMSVRIDHVYVPQEMVCVGSEVGRACGSDHRPVIARVAWRE